MGIAPIVDSVWEEVFQLKKWAGLGPVKSLRELAPEDLKAWEEELHATAVFIVKHSSMPGIPAKDAGDVANEFLEMAERKRDLEDSEEAGTIIMVKGVFERILEEREEGER